MWSEPKFTGLRSLESSQAPPNRVIAHYYKVYLISTLLDALTIQDLPPAHIEN